MLTPKQIQEARKLLTICIDEKIDADTLVMFNGSLRTALDTIEAQQAEIERLNSIIENIWDSSANGHICLNIECEHIECGSPECKKAFMEHYLGGDGK